MRIDPTAAPERAIAFLSRQGFTQPTMARLTGLTLGQVQGRRKRLGLVVSRAWRNAEDPRAQEIVREHARLLEESKRTVSAYLKSRRTK